MERDNRDNHYQLQHPLFQLTRSRGAWRCWRLVPWVPISFQLTRSRGAWHNYTVADAKTRAFQLTRSRGAWLEILSWLSNLNPISTHTLTWSVTLWKSSDRIKKWFQLTRSRGAWPDTQLIWIPTQPFQLTRSRGAWHFPHEENKHTVRISTHTLTWSVTIFNSI